jgi:uncharacterized membrane protein
MALGDRTSVHHRLAAIATAVVFTALALTNAVPMWVAAQPTAPAVEAPTASGAAGSAGAKMRASRKGKNIVGLRAHGFVAENGVFTTIDAPGAGSFTVVFGIDESGKTVGGYVDRKGTLHGFLRGQEAFTVIDYPGAAATFAARMNARGQIVGAYSEEKNTPALDLTHGFLLDHGVFTTIDVPGAVRTQPYGINTHGQILGEYLDATGTYHGFLLDQGVYTSIDAPGAANVTMATDIDDRGRIVGVFFDAAGAVHGFLRDEAEGFTPIDAPDAAQTQPFGINNRGQIVGSYVGAQVDDRRIVRGFLLDSGVFTPIEAPDATAPRTIVSDINERGQIIGIYSETSPDTQVGTDTRGFLFDGGEVTRIDVPGAMQTQAFDIDSDGRIVGEYLDAAGTFHGYLRDHHGNFTTIDLPGATGTSITGINDHGQMIGIYGDASGTPRAFLLDQGVVTTFDVPGAVLVLPFGLNNRAEVVGVFDDGLGGDAFMFSNGTLTTPAAPPGTFATSFPVDIDDRGRIFGVYF